MKILACGDLHLSEHKPICRTDVDWVETQQKHLNQILNTAIKEKVDVIAICGDIFDTSVVHPVISNMVADFILACRKFCAVEYIAGNHDEKYRRYDSFQDCSFGVLDLLRHNKLLDGVDYGDTDFSLCRSNVIMLHTFAVKNIDDKPPMRESMAAIDLCHKFPLHNVIITGDNHKSWWCVIGDHLLVNCGTLIQRTAAEAKEPCGFYIVDTDELTAEYVDLSDMSKDCIDTTYLDDIKEREENKEAYSKLLAELQNGVENKYDFISTLSEYVESNRTVIGEGVYNTLQKVIECIKGEKQ